ncbi:alpha/beta hydrolase [Ponticaulis sp.]|uniref:alpha/beta fold hydrolase n=1 Tax=Ponticaulis sp. TaxID=2020902 RepID=UPI002629DF86|nr:alpha/beta hydrolase [Ponticaulis sp.]MDF1680616.1 alpha/beta hydrolase [Ponticaulis sp.]
MNQSVDTYLYCHGFPGSDADLAWFTTFTDLPLIAAPFGHDGEFNSDILGDGGVHLVGFSLGAMSAIEIATAHPDKIARLTLISPAGPLELGDFLDDMAGGAVFKAARDNWPMYETLLAIQSFLTSVLPGMVRGMIMSGAPEADSALLRDKDFRRAFDAGMKYSYGSGKTRFNQVVKRYVAAWSEALNRVVCPVTIYQGIADTWTPPAMGRALHDAFPSGQSELIELEGLAHFSTLKAAISKLN